MATKAAVKVPEPNEMMIGQVVQVQSVIPHLEPIEGTLREMNQYGAVTDGEWRGSKYLTLTPWAAIRALEVRVRLEETSKPEEKPANSKADKIQILK